MLQVDNHPAKHDHFVATPLIRFSTKPTYSRSVTAAINHLVNCKSNFKEENMKKYLLTIVVIFGLTAAVLPTQFKATVNGMVCGSANRN